MNRPNVQLHRRTFVRALGTSLLVGAGLHTTVIPTLAQRLKTNEEDAGLLGPGEYESPDYGYAISWDDTWDTSPNSEGISVEVREDASGPVNMLRLGLVESEGSWTATFTGYTIGDELAGTPERVGEEFVALYEDLDPDDLSWSDYQTLTSDFDDESGAVLMYHVDDGRPLLSLMEVRLLDDSTAIIRRLMAPPSVFVATYESAQNAIGLDRDTPFVLLTTRDVQQAAEDAKELADKRQGQTRDNDDEPDDDSGSRTDAGQNTDDAYLADVRDHYDELAASVDRFAALLGGSALSDADVDEINTIVTLWADASDTAAALDAPASQSKIEDAHLAYAEALGDAASAFGEFLDSEEGSADADRAIADFQNALDNAQSLGTSLDTLLTDAGV